MDLREYLAIADAIPAVRTREDVVAVVARIVAVRMDVVERRVLARRLAAAARVIDPTLATEVAVDLLPSVEVVPRHRAD